jgi:hypothetical protein
MQTKKFHLTWFVDKKKTMLAGTTVEAEDISDAIKVLCKKKIQLQDGRIVDIEIIKYVMEL